MCLPWGQKAKLQHLPFLLSILLHSSSLLSLPPLPWLPHPLPSSPFYCPAPSSLYFLTPPSPITHLIPTLSYPFSPFHTSLIYFPIWTSLQLDKGYTWMVMFTMIARFKCVHYCRGVWMRWPSGHFHTHSHSCDEPDPFGNYVIGHTRGCPEGLDVCLQLPSYL